jgi:hypothetical protein
MPRGESVGSDGDAQSETEKDDSHKSLERTPLDLKYGEQEEWLQRQQKKRSIGAVGLIRVEKKVVQLKMTVRWFGVADKITDQCKKY